MCGCVHSCSNEHIKNTEKKVTNATTAMAAAAGVAAAANIMLPKKNTSSVKNDNDAEEDENKTSLLTETKQKNDTKEKLKKRFSFKKRAATIDSSPPRLPKLTPTRSTLTLSQSYTSAITTTTTTTTTSASHRLGKTITAQPFTALFQLQLLRQLTPAFQPQEQEILPEMVEATETAINYSREWTRLAEIFDRLFFWLFLLAIILSTLGLFHPLILETGPNIQEGFK